MLHICSLSPSVDKGWWGTVVGWRRLGLGQTWSFPGKSPAGGGSVLVGVKVGFTMGVESHFCSVSPSPTVYIHNTHSYTDVYRLMLPSLCPAQQGPGNGGVCGWGGWREQEANIFQRERRGLQGGWINEHPPHGQLWEREREMVGCRGHRVWWEN